MITVSTVISRKDGTTILAISSGVERFALVPVGMDVLSTGNEDVLTTGDDGVGSVHTVVVVPDVKALK